MEEKFKVKHLNPIMTSIMAPIAVSLVVSLMTSIEDRGVPVSRIIGVSNNQ